MADDATRTYARLDGTDELVPGHRILQGTDLEISYNLMGDDLMLRVNKSGIQVFRVKLKDASKRFSTRALISFNPISPDFAFRIGDTRARMLALARGVGLDADQLAKLDDLLVSLGN